MQGYCFHSTPQSLAYPNHFTVQLTGYTSRDVDFDDFFVFADNFGKTGAPDTLRVVVMDTVVVTVSDSVIVLDTVAVVDPDPSHYDNSAAVWSRTDTSDPLDGLRNAEIEHFVDSFRLGPGLLVPRPRSSAIEPGNATS